MVTKMIHKCKNRASAAAALLAICVRCLATKQKCLRTEERKNHRSVRCGIAAETRGACAARGRRRGMAATPAARLTVTAASNAAGRATLVGVSRDRARRTIASAPRGMYGGWRAVTPSATSAACGKNAR